MPTSTGIGLLRLVSPADLARFPPVIGELPFECSDLKNLKLYYLNDQICRIAMQQSIMSRIIGTDE